MKLFCLLVRIFPPYRISHVQTLFIYIFHRFEARLMDASMLKQVIEAIGEVVQGKCNLYCCFRVLFRCAVNDSNFSLNISVALSTLSP
jgi:hypothetical protein